MALFDGHLSVSDGIAVFDYLVAFCKVFQCDFMTGRNVFRHCDADSIDGDGFACLEFCR